MGRVVVGIDNDGGFMGQRGRPTARIMLDGDQRDTLERWARRPKTGQALALRCRIVLAAADGAMNQDIARELGCSAATVGKWRRRFAEKRLDGLLDEPRPGQPRKITDDMVEQVIVTTLETTPDDGSTQWSTRAPSTGAAPAMTATSPRIRKRIEEPFGWIKTIAGGRKLRYFGQQRNRAWFLLTGAVYNIVRITDLDLQPT